MRRRRIWTIGVLTLALVVGATPDFAPAVAATVNGRHGLRIQPHGDGDWQPSARPGNTTFHWHAAGGRSQARILRANPKAKRVKELTGRRTANTSVYQMSDGSLQQVVSAGPAFYQDAHGAWQSIDPTVRPLSHGGFTAGSEADSFHTYFSANSASLVRLEQGGASISVGADGASTKAPKLSGSSAAYPGAYPNADLGYKVGPEGVKESVVLTKAPAAGQSYSFTMKLGGGLTPRQAADGAIEFFGSEANTPVFAIPAPYMSDAKDDKNSPYGKAYSAKVAQTMTWNAATGTLRLTLTPDRAWLKNPNRAYPVTIDPTVLVSPTSTSAANTMILADGPTTNYSTSWRLSVGTTATGAARSLIKFPMPTVPAGTTITSADLQLYYDQTFTTGANSVPMQALQANAAWDPTTATWSNASSIGGPVAGTTTMTANALGVWDDFPVTSAVQNWTSGSAANNGFVVKATNETPLGQGGPRFEGSLYSYGGEVVNYPKLVITYGVPGVAVNPPTVIHATGAELSWPAYTNTTGNSANDLAEYQVHRSVYQTFTPGSSTVVSPVDRSQTTFVDSTATPTPANNSDPYGNAYYYMVVVKTKGGQLISGPTQLVRLPEAGRTTLLIPSVAATTLSSTLPTTVLNTLSNAGTAQPWLEVGDDSGTYGVTRAALDFGQLPQVPAGSQILDAHLKLWQETTTTGTSGAVYELHGLTRSFTGNQATWNSAATGTAWTTPGGDFTPTAAGTQSGFTNDPYRRNFDATSVVQGWINTAGTDHGLLVKLAGEATSSPQERTIFAGPNTAEPRLAPQLVVTYLDNSTGATYYAPSTPTKMTPGTTYAEPVTINNTTSTTWTAANVVLTYHWTLPDGTDVTAPANQLQTALPSDLAPAATVTLNAQVTPPAPSDGNQQEGYTLAWDMYNKTTGAYLSSGSVGGASPATVGIAPKRTNRAVSSVTPMAAGGGIGSLKQQTGVNASGNNQLGLEKFYQYTTVPTGAGSNLDVNNTGNTVWNDDLFTNPSRGFSTSLRLSYNSMDTTDTTTGFGWSIQASAPTRLGQALSFHPQKNPTAVVMDDGTGNMHQWNWNAGTSSWTSPPGVHLFLQQLDSCGPQVTDAKAWSMTRPDGTVIYYDCEGYPTSVIDANGNEADFTYSARQSQNKPEEFLSYLTDPVGRQTLALAYYNKGDASYSYIDSTGALVTGSNLTNPAISDHVKSVTDVSGRTVNFYYTSQGLLGRVVDGAGSGVAQTFNFTYDATQGMKNVKLTAVQDPRGNTTRLAFYPPSSATKWWTQSVTDRLGKATSFAYAQPGTIANSATQTTVTNANNNNFVYQSDSSGRMIQAANPLGQKTTLGWGDNDNNVTSLVEDNGARSTWSFDPNTGYPLSQTDAVQNAGAGPASTTYTYQTSLSGHVAYLTDKVTAAGRRWHYTYDLSGNMLTQTAPDGNVNGAAAGSYTTTYTYDAYGDLLTLQNANKKTATYANYDPSGRAGSVTDPMGNLTQTIYGPRGEAKNIVDPLGHTSTLDYDVLLRPLDSTVPKDQQHGVYITTPAPVYDANGNVTQTTSAVGAVTSRVYDADDRPSSQTLPADSSTSPARTFTYTYDNVGNRLTVTEPLGNLSGATPGSYTTTTGYDTDNQPTTVTNALGKTVVTTYDNVGNKTQLTDPKNNITRFGYDLDHRPTGGTDAQGHTTQVGYDADGLRTSTTDQNGSTTFYTLDPDGRVTQVSVPHTGAGATQVQNITQYTYDQVGNATSVISPLGVASGVAGAYTTSTVYDADNRAAKKYGAYLPGDATYGASYQPETDYSYDADSRVSSVTQPKDPRKPTTSFAYWDTGQTQQVTDPFNTITGYDYDNAGHQIQRSTTASDGAAARQMNWTYFPDGKTKTFTDSGVPNGWQDQVVTADSPDTQAGTDWKPVTGGGYQGATYYLNQGTVQTFTWNLTIPQDGNYTVNVYVPKDNTVTSGKYVVNHDGGAYTTSPPIAQNTHQGSWITLGKFAFKAGAPTSSASVVLSAVGAPVSADAVQIVRDNSADPQSGPASFGYGYDVNGNGTSVTDSSPNAQFTGYAQTYDQLNRLTQMQELNGTTATHTVGYTYDDDGNTASQSADARVDTYGYDSLNQLTQVVNKQSGADPGLTTTYTYTPLGERATETKANGNKVTSGYNLDGTTASTSEATAAGTVVDSHQLSYDSNNNIIADVTAVQNADTGSGNLSRTVTRTYSPNNQVTGVTNNPDNKFNQSYTYDSSGNISAETVNGGSAVNFTYDRGRLTQSQTGISTGSYEYDTLGRLHEIANGNVTGYVGSAAQQYTYDGFDNIVTSSQTSGSTTNTTTYTHDSLNRPTSEILNAGSSASQTSAFDYLGTTGVVLDENGTGTNAANKVYNYSPAGERLEMTNTYTAGGPGATTQNYFSYDPRGNVEALTAVNGSTEATYGYTAYGADDSTLDSGVDKPSTPPAATASLPFNAYRYNAARIDTATSTLNMGARTYDPNINRFLSRDSYNGAGADAGLAADPFNNSQYGFAGGNPVSNVELDGHSWSSFFGGAGAAIGAYATCAAIFGVETFGAAMIGCAAAAGAVGGASGQGIECAQGTAGACSGAAFAAATIGGAVGGAVGAGVGGSLAGSMASWAAGAIGGAAGGAAGGGVSYGIGCTDCSWGGLAQAVGTGAVVGGAFGGLGGALFGESGGAVGCGGESFSAATEVQLADGSTKAISELRAGDKVRSTDTATGRTKGSVTAAVWVKHDTDLYDLTVHTATGDQVIHTTQHHLFYDRTTHSWVEAASLHRNDRLTTDDGSVAVIVGGVVPALSSGDMWDLTVPGDHDFYVMAGTTPVLVHNCPIFKKIQWTTEKQYNRISLRYQRWVTGQDYETVWQLGDREIRPDGGPTASGYLVEAKYTGNENQWASSALNPDNYGDEAGFIDQAGKLLDLSRALGLKGVRYAVSNIEGAAYFRGLFQGAFADAMDSGELTVHNVPFEGMDRHYDYWSQ